MISSLASTFGLKKRTDPARCFHSDHYLRHNARRLEHLASLGVPVAGRTVLELGAGIGDHSTYYLDRGCGLTITEAREENLTELRARFPDTAVHKVDMDAPDAVPGAPFGVVHCYGLLYHLENPVVALDYMAKVCDGMLLLETCVSFGDEEAVHPKAEPKENPTQAASGMGCRPTRPWVFARLRERFAYVYATRTQPNHEEFPLDWSDASAHRAPLSRAVFVASHAPVENENLTPELPMVQVRHP